MEKLIEILEDVHEGVDYTTCKTLIDDHILDSFAILSLVSEIEDEFEIEVSSSELTAANFNSAESLWAMITRLQGEQ